MILGIDPGYGITGFAVIESEGQNTLIDHGTITTAANSYFYERLSEIKLGITELIKTYPITHCAIEKVYFNSNQKTATDVAQARGVIIESIYSNGVPITEYSPPQIKKAVTGTGNATKKDMQFMIQKLFNLLEPVKQDDACDAIGAAFCHKGHVKIELKIQK